MEILKKISGKIFKGLLIVFLAIAIIVFVIPNISSYLNKSRIINIVRGNQELLNSSIQEGSYNDVLKIDGVRDIHFFKTDAGNTYIDYFCSGFGIVPSSVYYGFYYHSIDEPIGYQGVNVKLTRDSSGWSWRQPGGDNWCYIEKIEDHWYYYEAGF